MALLGASAASAQSSSESALEQAEAKVDQVAEELESVRSRAEDARLELRQANERLNEVEAAVNEVARQLNQQREMVRQAEAELEQLEAETRQLQKDAETRAISLFKKGGAQSVELLLASGDFEDAMDRSAYLRALSSGTTTDLEALQTSQVAVEEQRRFLVAEQDHLEQMRAQREQLLQRVEGIRNHKAMAAAKVNQKVDHLEDHKDHLEAEVNEIEDLIEERQSRGVGGAAPVPVAASGSGYIWPACGGITSTFGYRWGRLHAGIDIDDPPTWIRAANAGRVIYAGYRGGYGRLTLIDHGDGVVTAYAHQSQQLVGEGQSVAQGEQIGVIGSTGNSTGPHLHFETRVNGSPTDPMQYLPAGGC